MDPLLTPEEVARRLSLSRRTVVSWLQAGRLRGVKVGNRWRIPEGQILSILSDSGGDVDLVWLEADLGEDLPEYDWGTEQPDVLPVALNEEGALMILDLADGK